jgi:asparagine synthase (glutamine-hydrolysing)
MMAGLMDEPVRTCSVTFDNPNYDEAAYASLIARRYGTSHHVEQVNPDDFTLVDRLATFYDEPFADSSAMPTYRVCELARRQVTVALSGDGGDENFAGYRRYRWHLYENFVRNFLPSNFRKPFFGFVGQFYPKLDWAPKPLRAKSTFESLAKDSVDGYFHSVSVLGDKLRARLYHDKFRAGLQGYHAVETLRAHALQAPTDHPLSLIQYLDIKTFLVGRILTKVDRASMANSLEVRVPILDHKFVEWVSCLPPELKLHGKEGKYIFKKSLEDYVPPEILYRPKMGFSVPLASWFRGPLKNRVSEVLLGERLSSMEFFNRSFLQHLLDQHLAGLRDYSEPIWSLLMFEAFHRQVIS